MTLSEAARNVAVDAVAALLDSGVIEFQTSGDVEVATCGFGADAFEAASGGSATANEIAADESAAGGVIAKAVLKTSGAAVVATCTVGTSGADFIFPSSASMTLGAGDTLEISSFTLSHAA